MDSSFVASSGNIFEDLGLPDAPELKVKAKLAFEIGEVIARRRLSQVQAVEVLGIDHPQLSALIGGQLGSFSIQRLRKFLRLLS